MVVPDPIPANDPGTAPRVATSPPVQPAETSPPVQPAETSPPEQPALDLPPELPTLELALSPEAAAALARHPAFHALHRQGRRAASVEITWHDTPEAELARQHQALSVERGIWRLERLAPADEIWPPATPAPALAEAPNIATLPQEMPATLPLASFSGRRQVLAGDTPAGPVTATLLTGTLRAFAGEAQACRLRLHGPGPALRALGLSLAETLPVGPPGASLAAEAQALARGTHPSPPRRGPPEVAEGATTEAALAGIVAHLVAVVLGWAPDVAGGQVPEAVHQMRVGVRRLRSALAVFGPLFDPFALAATKAMLKDLACQLAPARDWHVFLAETLPPAIAAFPDEPRLAALMSAARRRRHAAYGTLHAWMAGPGWRAMEIELACFGALAPWRENADPARLEQLAGPAAGFATLVLGRRTRGMLRAGADFAALSPSDMHEVRKRGKKLRYAAECFAADFPPRKHRRFVEKLADLQQELGQVNDAASVAALLADLPPSIGRGWAAGALTGFIAARRARVLRRAGEAWERFGRAEPFWD